MQMAGDSSLSVIHRYPGVSEIAKTLKNEMGDKAAKVPTRVLPNFLLSMVGWFDPTVRMIVPELGKVKSVSNAKAKEMLGM